MVDENKLEVEVCVKDLRGGDVISTKSSREWPYGAEVGENERDDDGPVFVFDVDGYPIGDRGFAPLERVWVKRVDHVRNLMLALRAHAPDRAAEDMVEAIYTSLIEAGINSSVIEYMIAGYLIDGLRHGNWPWV